MIISSSRFFRYNLYESFYALHVFLVPVTLLTAGMHHPSVGWWCWSTLVIWVAERVWRGAWWFWVNGIFKRKMPNALREPTRAKTLKSLPSGYVPPPGYAAAELMPGKTIRLTVLTPECRPWAPGQHFLLCIPSINKFTSHPFFAASVCDQETSNPAGRFLIFFIRAKAGWTKTLWDTVIALASRDKWHWYGEEPPQGTYPQIAVLCSVLLWKDPSARLRGLIGSSTRACCWLLVDRVSALRCLCWYISACV